MSKMTQKQITRRREWLDAKFQDACASRRDDAPAVAAAATKLMKLHPGQWPTHPAYQIVDAWVIDANPLND